MAEGDTLYFSLCERFSKTEEEIDIFSPMQYNQFVFQKRQELSCRFLHRSFNLSPFSFFS